MSDPTANESYDWLISVATLDHNRVISRNLRQAMLELDSKDVDIRKISDLLSKEPALTAKLMMIANSPFYGYAREVKDIEEAVVVLGAMTLRALVNSGLILVDSQDRMHQCYVTHSLVTASYARKITERLALHQESLFTAALFHILPVILNYRPGIEHLLSRPVLRESTVGLLTKLQIPDDIVCAVDELYRNRKQSQSAAVLRLAFNMSVLRLDDRLSPFTHLFNIEQDFSLLNLSPDDMVDMLYDGWDETRKLIELVGADDD